MTQVCRIGPFEPRTPAVVRATSARKHGFSDDDMLHAVRHHWRAFETNDPDVTMFIGPSATSAPLEDSVVTDDDGIAIVHAMPARKEFLSGWWTP
jgi:hypothetical protein